MSKRSARDRESLEREPHAAASAEEMAARARRLLAEWWGHQLAETRKRLGRTQRELATALGVTISRISQIEHGDTSFDGIARYIEALGGRLDLVAHFGDRIVRMPVSDASATAA